MLPPLRTTLLKNSFIQQRKIIDSERAGEGGSREEIHQRGIKMK